MSKVTENEKQVIVEDGTMREQAWYIENHMKKYYPNVTKPKEIVIKSEQDRIQEGKIVADMIKNTEYIPKEEGVKYHIISMKWYLKWKAYTLQDQDEEQDDK